MENLTIVLFLCIVMPLFPVLFILPDKRSRILLGYLMIGVFVCMAAAYVNTQLFLTLDREIEYITTNITPISEELMKALPVLLFAWIVSDDRDTLVSIAFVLGVGFAILENAVILTQSIEEATVTWALFRGIGAALMHGTCTAAVGLGLGFIRKRKKLFYCGTFSLLIVAILYHAIFNSLVQSSFRMAAFFLPGAVYVIVAEIAFAQRHSRKSTYPEKAGAEIKE